MQFKPKHLPAFPSPSGFSYKGLSVRDYFASHAMSGMLAAPTVTLDGDGYNRIARVAYEIADAMLAARGEEPQVEQSASIEPLEF